MNAATVSHLPVSIVSFKKVSVESDVSLFSYESPKIEIWGTEDFFCQKNVEATVPWGKLYSKHLFKDLRYPVGKIHEDEFLTYQIIFQTNQIAYISEPMYWYFQNFSGTVHSKWDIPRLAKIQAFKQQMDWFERKGYDFAYRTRVNSYAWIICESIKQLSESDIINKRKYIRRLKRKLRSFLKEKKTFFSPTSTATKWVYQVAYPTEMKVRKFFHHKLNSMRTLGIQGIVNRIIRSKRI